jgi:hypothetical protein
MTRKLNNTMVREIHGVKINPKSSLKIRMRKIRGGANYTSKYGSSRRISKMVLPSSRKLRAYVGG